MAEYIVTDNQLSSIANAIRSKCGISSSVSYPNGFIDLISDISVDEYNKDIADSIVGGYVTEYENDNLESLTYYAFAYCFALTTVSFPACTTIGDSAFYSCTSLTSVSFPACTSIGNSAFYSCTRLTSVSFPACTSIGNNAFIVCYSLTTASFPSCTTIGASAFCYCYNLTSLYLLGSSVVTIGVSVFYSTPIGGYSASAGQYGSVFVPASLYNSYIVATNWSSISSRIVSA